MPTYAKDSFCSYCGAPFAGDQGWPRLCAQCQQWSYRNPLPVVVVLLPVGEGVLAVRRAHRPAQGQLALPGGFIELPESWQEAGARELQEETGVQTGPERLTVFRVYSAPDGTLLIFALAPAHSEDDLPPFSPSPEASERVILPAPVELAFSLHTRVLGEYFAGREAS
jgi:ADP-ribose pyrophosphatase YjhB (NUDIX family)